MDFRSVARSHFALTLTGMMPAAALVLPSAWLHSLSAVFRVVCVPVRAAELHEPCAARPLQPPPQHIHTLLVGSPGDRVVGDSCLGLCMLLWRSCDPFAFIHMWVLGSQHPDCRVLMGSPHLFPYPKALASPQASSAPSCCSTPGGCSLSLLEGQIRRWEGGGMTHQLVWSALMPLSQG